MKEAGLVVAYTGQGKGKTTAALGMVFRALGHGLRVAVVQFVKGRWQTGERLLAPQLTGLEFHVMGRGFTWESDDLAQDHQAATLAFAKACALMQDPDIAVLVLDEVSYVLNYGFVSSEDLLLALAAKPKSMTVVLTGRHMPEPVLAVADLITDMRPERHPYTSGKKALRGVDY